MKVRYTPRARGDIDAIFQYLDERSPSGARNVVAAIYAGVQFIAENPEAAQRTEQPSASESRSAISIQDFLHICR